MNSLVRIIIKHNIATKIEKKHGVKVSEFLEVFEGKLKRLAKKDIVLLEGHLQEDF